MVKILMIAAGGGVGSVMRYLLAGWCQAWSGGTFPIGTLVVNVLGCLAIGVLNTALTSPLPIREEYRVALTVGILGGFTTFSTFGLETVSLVNERQWLWAGANILGSLVLSLAAVWIGMRLSEKWLGV
ncbi:MAG TPA: fluoride efflux transporter CrcB [Phycisphaerae bacterium]|nr:fluoride efflux transporter CrcB [Phycisphaerae bacterium]HRY68349.1 fluoride efflux transporter CrcB [Phycisphaerae bacterium]HSA26768.1 fluoride efflux transporter CrcB [Phycisphaerae bacterium]